MSSKSLSAPFLVTNPDPARPAWSYPRTDRGRRKPIWERLKLALRSAWRRRRTRIALAQLDAHLLKDIGISFAEAENEANKPFWRA